MSQISLQMYTLRDYTKTSYDLEKTLEKLRGAGFSTVQYSVPGEADVSDICRIFRKTGIQNDSVFCPALSIKERKKDVLSQCDAFETDYIRTDSIPRGLTSNAAGYEMFAHYLNEVVCAENFLSCMNRAAFLMTWAAIICIRCSTCSGRSLGSAVLCGLTGRTGRI